MRFIQTLAILLGAGVTALAQTDSTPPSASPNTRANNDTNVRAMSLEDCFVAALEHNFDIQIVRYDPRMARFTLAASYGAYDPALSLSGQHDYTLQPGGVDSQGRIYAGSEIEGNTLSAGLSGLLPWGLNYRVGSTASDRWGTKPGFTTDPNTVTGYTTNYFTDLGGNTVGLINTNYLLQPARLPFENTSAQAGFVELRQPLLKNFWIDQTRLSIYVNKQQVKMRESDFRDQVISTITAVETAYFQLVYADENVRVQNMALELKQQLLAENKKKVEVGALAPLDEKQAESEVAAVQADLLQAQANRATQERVLKDLLSDQYTSDWANVMIRPTDRLLAIPQQYNLQESWSKGLEQGPRYRLEQGRLAVEQNKRQVRYARNQLFPQLDVIGSYGYNGSGQEFSDALNQIRERDNPSWSVGAAVSIPLSRTAERNNYKVAKAAQEQSVLQLKQAEQKTLIFIENDIATAQSSFERVAATRQARSYAEAALDAEQKKLENGKSTSFQVLSLQNDLTAARLAEIRALADYNIALANLAYDEGSTLERRKVELEPNSLSTQVYR
jgi:outer membrane protein TolC